MIKNIVFDIGGVLVNFDWEDYLDRYHFTREVRTLVEDAVFTGGAWNEMDRGVLSEEDILSGFIAKAPQIEKEIRKVFVNIFDSISGRDYPVKWVQNLKERGFRIYFLSNYSKRGYEETKEILTPFLSLMDGGLFSYKVKKIKPDPAIYQDLLAQEGLNAEECLFVDDVSANVDGARAVGMHSICFTNEQEVWNYLEQLEDPS